MVDTLHMKRNFSLKLLKLLFEESDFQATDYSAMGRKKIPHMRVRAAICRVKVWILSRDNLGRIKRESFYDLPGRINAPWIGWR